MLTRQKRAVFKRWLYTRATAAGQWTASDTAARNALLSLVDRNKAWAGHDLALASAHRTRTFGA